MAVDKLVDSTQLNTDLTSIANAIRTKGGTSAQLAFPSGFVSAVNAIPTGTTEPEEKDVIFIDYDGTIVYSYTAAEAQALTELPANPSHSGLTAQGWNWTLQGIKTQLTNVGGMVIVGQMYTTASGKTEIDIVLDDPDYLSPYLMLAVNGSISVDWGDESNSDTMTGTSLTVQVFQQHTYSQPGEYTIKITVTSGSFAFYSAVDSRTSILRYSTSDDNSARERVYGSKIIFVKLADGANIGKAAFNNLISLKGITLYDGITTLSGDNSFKFLSSLNCVVLPKSITALSSYCFSSSYGLRYISIPEACETIRNSITSCAAVRNLTIPYNVSSITNEAFSSDSSLMYINFPNAATLGNRLFYGCYNLRKVNIPSSATSIGSSMFEGCYALQDLSIPETVTSLGNTAFQNCYSFHNVTIPKYVTSIGSNTFTYCTGVKEYHLKPESPPTLSNTNAFTGIMAGTIIYVPRGKLTAYQTANNWASYSTYMQEEPA